MFINNIQYYINKFNINDYFETDISSHMTLHQYKKGEEILTYGNPMEYFYFIVKGKVKIFLRLENGKSLLLRFANPLSSLGDAEVQKNPRVCTGNVQPVFETLVIKIPFSIIDKYVVNDSTFLKYIVKSLGDKLTTSSNAHSLNTSYPFKNRFASYLISISHADDVERIDEISTENFSDLATFLGTSYRHLCRVVRELEDEKLIKKEGKQFIILDYDGLESLSGGFYE